MKLPTKPIEKVYIFDAGDPTVGIPRTSFEMTLFFDLSCYEHPETVLAENRLAIASLYEELHGERLTVMFDYEIEELNLIEKSLDKEQAMRDEKSLNDWNKEV